jgi:two-component system, OmpR family, response regulator CpxR
VSERSQPEPIGLIRVNEHCLFTWKERGSRRVVEVREVHCVRCVTEVRRLGFGIEGPEPEGAKRKCVLIVDDDSSTRDALKLLLDDEGYVAYTASDGKEALDLLRQIEAPSLILLDMMMPRMDGPAFLLAKDSRRELAAVPVVLITASEAQLPTGRVELLRKPFHPQTLLCLISQHCRPR